MAKLDNKKLLACCANGAGSSLMMENAIKKVMKKYDVKYGELRHCSVSEGKSAARTYDVIFCARTFRHNVVRHIRDCQQQLGLRLFGFLH